jgi:hypothetical protein
LVDITPELLETELLIKAFDALISFTARLTENAPSSMLFSFC